MEPSSKAASISRSRKHSPPQRPPAHLSSGGTFHKHPTMALEVLDTGRWTAFAPARNAHVRRKEAPLLDKSERFRQPFEGGYTILIGDHRSNPLGSHENQSSWRCARKTRFHLLHPM